MQRGTRIAAVAAFLILVFIAVPMAIAAAHRTDLYYTLSSVALLSIASGGVWLTFYIGRINIGQGAFALVGGYVSAILVSTYGLSFWLSLPLAGLFCAAASVLVGLPILRLRGVYFAMVTLVLTEVARLSALALSVTNGAKGITSIPAPGPISLFGLTIVPAFDTFAEPIFDPDSKAPLGQHDENMTTAELTALVGEHTASELARITLAVYQRGADLAAERGIIVADTKIELGVDAAGTLRLGDEVLTPDSSRFWPAASWQPGRSQVSYDKQFVRDWLTSPASGWDRQGNEPPPPLPDSVIEQTRQTYVAAYEGITGTRWH